MDTRYSVELQLNSCCYPVIHFHEFIQWNYSSNLSSNHAFFQVSLYLLGEYSHLVARRTGCSPKKVHINSLSTIHPLIKVFLLSKHGDQRRSNKNDNAPAKFFELQIDAYLKTVAFRREINEVKKAAGGRGVVGVQNSRIAFEANRECIFSSSFTGNRSVTSSGVDASSNTQSQIAARTPFIGSINSVASTSALSSAFESFLSERKKGFHEDIEIYLFNEL